VQHGASHFPNEAFDRFPATGTEELHLATGFQNIVLPTARTFPPDLRTKIYEYVNKEAASDRKRDTEEQFHLQDRKRGWARFKARAVGTCRCGPGGPRGELEAQFALLFKKAQCGGNTRDGEPLSCRPWMSLETSGRPGVVSTESAGRAVGLPGAGIMGKPRIQGGIPNCPTRSSKRRKSVRTC